MPRKKKEVRAHFGKTFHPVFRHLRREIVKTIVFDVLNECEWEFIDWLYYQLEEFIEFQEDGDHSDCFDEEDVYVTDKGFPLAPELELDRREEEGEHTDTSELNASAFENRSLLRNNEEKKRKESTKSEDPVSSDDSSELSADEEDEEGSSEEGSHEASPSPKKKSSETSTSSAQLSTSSLLSKSSGCHSQSASDTGQSIDSSNVDGSEGNGSELSTSSQRASEMVQEESNSNSKSNSSNNCSSQYSTLTSEKLKERAGNFQPGKVKQVLGNQTMNLDLVDELSMSRVSSEASDT